VDTKTKIIIFISLFILVIGCGSTFFIGRIGNDKIAKQLDESVAESGRLRGAIRDAQKAEKRARDIIKQLSEEQQRLDRFIELARKENIHLKSINRQNRALIDGLSKNHQGITNTINNSRATVKELREIIRDSLQTIQNQTDNE